MVVVMAQDAAPQDIDAVVELVRGAGGEAFVSRGYPARSSGWSVTLSSSMR
jgi:hypothetical protein